VAGLAGRSGEVAGLPVADQVKLRRAGLVHDIGRVAVPVNVWAKRGPLNRDEYEQVRLHAYHTERVLDAAAGLRPLARLAGSHGERCDGSGYHRGNRAAELPMTAWLLAAADCYHAMREPRPHRPALTAAAAADELAREAAVGTLAPQAVHAVLAAAGQPLPGRPAGTGAAHRPPARQATRQPAGAAGHRPAGLSERECEVLGLLARGLATKQVARRLGISPKTCDHHIQRLYGKAGVSTRAGATLFALEHGLVRPGETAIR
jgi:DNA-binding CsgD family transcriptional regulator